MKFPALLVSDLHLTDNPQHAYRWELFPWLIKRIVQYRIQTVVIMGDLTDAKDNHSSTLVNRVVAEVDKLRTMASVIILPGNHDYLRAGHPFFEFLRYLPDVRFVSGTLDTSAEGPHACLFLAHVRNPAQAWAGLDFSHYRYLFIHQTFKGALSSNGQALDGEALPDLSAAGKVWSGDVHVPQVIGAVEYVGSPYPVHCGDSFKGRCIVLGADHSVTPLHFRTIDRHSIKVTSLEELEAVATRRGDHAAVAVSLPQSESHLWRTMRIQIKEWAEQRGVDLVDLSMKQTKQAVGRVRVGVKAREPDEILLQFVRRYELGGDALHVGLEVLQCDS